MTAAIYNFSRLTGTDLGTVGHRVMVADLVQGGILLDPDNATFLPRYVWVASNHPDRNGWRSLAVRTIADDGHLSGGVTLRRIPGDTFVTAYDGPAEPEVG